MTSKKREADLSRMVIAPNPNAFSMARQMARNAPAVGIFDEPARCYRVNEAWAAHIAGCVSILAEPEMWVGADDETHAAIQSILQFLIGTVCDVLDCADVEDCLETSPITDAIAIVSFTQMEAQTQAHIDALLLLYDGTAQSIGAAIPTTAPNLDSLQDSALCKALVSAVTQYAFTKAIKLQDDQGVSKFFQTLVLAIRTVWRDMPAWLAFLLGDELYGCALNVGAALLALQDSEAQFDVACCLYDDLRGVPMTQTAWDSAVSSCAASVTGLGSVIACLLNGDNDLSIYVSFLEFYNEAILKQQAGTNYNCLCAPPGWFWVEIFWKFSKPFSGGGATTPVFTVTNPANGKLFAIVERTIITPPADGSHRPADTNLGNEIVAVNPPVTGSGLLLWEDQILGVFEGADALDWPSAQRRNVDMVAARREPSQTWTIQWSMSPDQGKSASWEFSGLRLLYKEVP